MTQPPIAVPVCYRHPTRETYVCCVRCERPICPDCMIEASVGHQCPDCVRAGLRTQRPARTVFGADPVAGARGIVTKALIAVNCAVALLGLMLAARESGGGQGLSLLTGGMTPLHHWGALVAGPTQWVDSQAGVVIATAAGVSHGEYYRLFTSMFLHYGLLHLMMNMWALWMLGRSLETVFGPARFLALYMLSGLGGSAAVYAFGDPAAATAGASGAIFGLFAALFVALRRLGRDSSSVVPVLVINLVITFMVPGISIAGHLGGLATGALVATGLAYAPQKNRTVAHVGACVGVAVVLIVAVLVRTASLVGGIGS